MNQQVADHRHVDEVAREQVRYEDITWTVRQDAMEPTINGPVNMLRVDGSIVLGDGERHVFSNVARSDDDVEIMEMIIQRMKLEIFQDIRRHVATLVRRQRDALTTRIVETMQTARDDILGTMERMHPSTRLDFSEYEMHNRAYLVTADPLSRWGRVPIEFIPSTINPIAEPRRVAEMNLGRALTRVFNDHEFLPVHVDPAGRPYLRTIRDGNRFA